MKFSDGFDFGENPVSQAAKADEAGKYTPIKGRVKSDYLLSEFTPRYHDVMAKCVTDCVNRRQIVNEPALLLSMLNIREFVFLLNEISQQRNSREADVFSLRREARALRRMGSSDYSFTGIWNEALPIPHEKTLGYVFESMCESEISPYEAFYYLIMAPETATVKMILKKFNLMPTDFEFHSAYTNVKRGIPGTFEIASEREELSLVLDKYGYDIGKNLAEKNAHPVVGRESEIRMIESALMRDTKNNPLLIGEPGVGKTAVVEGLAQKISSGDVPDELHGLSVYCLNMSSIISGAGYTGELEGRMNDIMDVVEEHGDEVIVFIDEIHTIMEDSNSKIKDILKPALARGRFRLIGATTQSEYIKYIEPDGAMARRFQNVTINEPSESETETILRGISKSLEASHEVKIEDSAIGAAVAYSQRFMPDRNLPDKAIDLLEEACVFVSYEQKLREPSDISKIKTKIERMREEYESAEASLDRKSARRAEELTGRISWEERQLSDERRRWKKEIENSRKVGELSERVREMKTKLKDACTDYDFMNAAALKYDVLPRTKEALYAEIDSMPHRKYVHDTVGPDEIAYIVSVKTGIPSGKISEEDKDRTLTLAGVLKERIIGQDEACDKIARAIMRSKAGIANTKRPIGSFLFVGSTGTGKTELAKVLASHLFDTSDNLLRLDMSEFLLDTSVNRLLGADAGYVGYDDEGVLSGFIRRHPYSVILFDEIEKANSNIRNLLLQIIDEGVVTDSHGRKCQFSNAIIILTSNLGDEYLIRGMDGNGNVKEESRKAAQMSVEKTMSPELINRLDEAVVFNPLSFESCIKIAGIFLNELSDRLSGEEVKARFDSSVSEYVVRSAYDPEHGARPISRFISDNIETMLAEGILGDKIIPGSSIFIYADENGLQYRKDS